VNKPRLNQEVTPFVEAVAESELVIIGGLHMALSARLLLLAHLAPLHPADNQQWTLFTRELNS
jgi:hypothetical protein